jgi:hypothetical protein
MVHPDGAVDRESELGKSYGMSPGYASPRVRPSQASERGQTRELT